jgi:co-chaperonin GroES (HSP10)
MRVLGNRVLIRYVNKAEASVAGLIIPVDERTATKLAEVLAVNVNEKDLKVGDKILVPSGSGIPAKEGVIVPKDDVLGVIE